jgi:hypothetical protein
MYPRRWVKKQSRRLAFILARRIIFSKTTILSIRFLLTFSRDSESVLEWDLLVPGLGNKVVSPVLGSKLDFTVCFFYGSEEESVDVLESHHLSLITVKARIMRTTHSEVRVEGDDVRCKTALQSSNKPSASNPILKQQYFLQIIVKKNEKLFFMDKILRQ